MQYEEPRAGAVTIKIVSSIYKFRKKMVNIYNNVPNSIQKIIWLETFAI